jgi:raffinose/stachyose/melibiose transport system substrate-binding protein
METTIMAKKHIVVGAAAVAVSLLLAGCQSGGTPSDSGKISGTITVLTQRTDLVDNVFQDYKKAFEKKYPDVTVKFEAITDYEGELAVRMNTDDYGDVLLIPNSVTKDKLANFFEPLGTVAELKKKYLFVDEQAYKGKGYGIAITGNAQGYVYNKKVWAAAGVTDAPKTPDEFITDLKAIKSKTDAIPLYTNYKDGWPMSQWEGNTGFTGPDAVNHLTEIDAPWAPGQEHFIIDSLLYDSVHDGLTEPDPTTTNWENSKTLIGTGKVATMVLGSWAIVQMQQAATAAGASADDIGYWPFPSQVDGKFHSTVGGDYKNAINIHSKHKAAARAWIDWFANDSGYATDQGGISPVVGGALPATLAGFKPLGVELVQLTPAPAGKESLESTIYNGAEIDLWGNVYRQKLVDIARGAAPGDKDSYFADLNAKWKAARAEAEG